jgi:uncharacterized protein
MEEKTKEIFDKYEVVLGYIFGSYARGTEGPMSDIDVAVVFPFSLSDKEQKEKIENIRSEIQRAFNINHVDVINLGQNKSPALRHDIIFKGKAILIKNENLKKTLEIKAVQDFEDTKYMRAVQFNILKEKIYVTHQQVKHQR